jgi:hypothetical protein
MHKGWRFTKQFKDWLGEKGYGRFSPSQVPKLWEQYQKEKGR